jgi:adenosylcobyric acid synthase
LIRSCATDRSRDLGGRERGDGALAMTRPLMILGTSSHVGKSILTAAFCRIFASTGYSVAPFKSQNMSLNSAATPEGLEIGRAQALQAEAAGIAASVHMNPILLKPMRDAASQIIVRGKIWAQLSAGDYHRSRVRELWPFVEESYRWLAERHDVVVIEGAGSPAEINLKQNDIANMRVAEMSDAACILVGDIDRGGVFASLLGTLELLEPEERARIRGFIVNKFRGDVELLKPGLRMMEQRIGIPCLGVVPHIHRLELDEEDSVSLDGVDRSAWASNSSPERALRIAIVAFPSMSNFTDFDALRSEPSLHLRFCRDAAELAGADVVLLPGSKQTIEGLRWLKLNGWAPALRMIAEQGLLFGICGGMQMLGTSVVDAPGVEGGGEEAGLGMLPLRTVMLEEKITCPVEAEVCSGGILGDALAGAPIRGYEIHVGETHSVGEPVPFCKLRRLHETTSVERSDGCVSANGRVFGTYLHGLFDEDFFRHRWIDAARSASGLSSAPVKTLWKQKRENELDRLQHVVCESVDLAAIFTMVGLPFPTPEFVGG